MALQDFVGQAWPLFLNDPSAADGDAGRAASVWRLRRAAGAISLRSPSRRLRRADMPRGAFLVLAFGWAFAVASLLAAVLVLRWLG